MPFANLLADLNEKQKEAVTAPLGNSLILAGAGSGKTRVLVSRIAWLMTHHHIPAPAILAVTFTNKAAQEMRERLKMLVQTPGEIWMGTFHGLCHRLLRRHYQEANLPAQFHILDSDDQARLVKRIIAAFNLDINQWPHKAVQAFINGNKDEGLRPHHLPTNAYGQTQTYIKLYQAYERACQEAGVIDFAELLLRTHELLRDNAELQAHYRERFQAILVDEFQDTNTIQYAWIRLLAGEKTNVMVVGDDDQSIYGWRGAKVENIQQFQQDFANTQLIRLEQNYRSTSTILDAANALIANNDARLGKTLWTAGHAGEKITLYRAFNELDEARFISDRIKAQVQEGINLDEMAILYRSNAQSRVIEEALLRGAIPYRIYGGVRFFERAEIKDSLAYLRFMANTQDNTAYERIINFPTRGIGDKTLEEIRAFASANACSLWQAQQDLLAQQHFSPRAALALQKFTVLIKTLQQNTPNLLLEDQIKYVIDYSGLYTHFSKLKGEKNESKLDNLQELVNAAKQFRDEFIEEQEESLLAAFLAHASLESGELQAAAYERSVHLMTLHSAKGLEFPLVFLIGLEEGIFPSVQSVGEVGRVEEERRLCYVGMTRAMKKLFISYAEIRRQYGREEYHRPSRFLREIPEELLQDLRATRQTQTVSPAQNTYSSHLKLGQLVSHPSFGSGVLMGVEGTGAHTRVQIKFASAGLKWLVLAYANLSFDENVEKL